MRSVMRLAISGFLAALVGLLASCGGASSRDGSMGTQEGAFLEQVSRHAGSPNEAAVDAGRSIYSRYCAICHGSSGGGDGFNAYNLKSSYQVTPAAFSDPNTWVTLDAATARDAITGGGGRVGKSHAMPAWGHTLTGQEIEEVLAYVQRLPMQAEP